MLLNFVLFKTMFNTLKHNIMKRLVWIAVLILGCATSVLAQDAEPQEAKERVVRSLPIEAPITFDVVVAEEGASLRIEMNGLTRHMTEEEVRAGIICLENGMKTAAEQDESSVKMTTSVREDDEDPVEIGFEYNPDTKVCTGFLKLNREEFLYTYTFNQFEVVITVLKEALSELAAASPAPVVSPAEEVAPADEPSEAPAPAEEPAEAPAPAEEPAEQETTAVE